MKQALEKGADVAIQLLGVQDGFMNNDKVRIELPDTLQGGDNSVPQFYSDKTRAPLTTEFMPTVKASLSKLGVVDQLNVIAGKLSGMGLLAKDKANLESHVTDKTLAGLHFMIGEEEKKIRQNPAEAGSALLSKVFGALR